MKIKLCKYVSVHGRRLERKHSTKNSYTSQNVAKLPTSFIKKITEHVGNRTTEIFTNYATRQAFSCILIITWPTYFFTLTGRLLSQHHVLLIFLKTHLPFKDTIKSKIQSFRSLYILIYLLCCILQQLRC